MGTVGVGVVVSPEMSQFDIPRDGVVNIDRPFMHDTGMVYYKSMDLMRLSEHDAAQEQWNYRMSREVGGENCQSRTQHTDSLVCSNHGSVKSPVYAGGIECQPRGHTERRQVPEL